MWSIASAINTCPMRVAELDHFLRDHRTSDVKEYDVKEFDLLHDLLVKLGHPDGEIDIVCGYRTPWSNNYLREHGHGVAEHSQHMEAKAIDIRIPGVSSARSAMRRCPWTAAAWAIMPSPILCMWTSAGYAAGSSIFITDKAALWPAPHSASGRGHRYRRRNRPRHSPQPPR